MKWPWQKRKGGGKTRSIATRGFAAAQTDRLLSGWRYDGGVTPSEISAHLGTIRARSREMAKDSSHFKRWLGLNVINIVGESFVLNSMPHDGPPSNQRLDEAAAKIIEYHWWKFCNWRDPATQQTYFDYTGRKTESDMDRLCVKMWKRDGEYFIEKIRTDLNPYGIAFRVLRPDWCDHTYNVSDTGRGTLIHCGVEKDLRTRRPVAYWFYTIPQNAHAYNRGGRPLVSIPASRIIHGFTQDDEDQPRGIPAAHAFLVKLKMLEHYDKAELTAAIDEACSIRQYTSEKPNDMDAFVDLTGTEEDAKALADALVMDKEPGQSEILPPGWKGEVTTPQHPNRELTSFKDSMLRDVASGGDVEYSNFANNWSGVSFSSVRVGTISERDAWKVAQSEMISQCKTPQFLAWLQSFLELSVSGSLPMEKYEKFSEHEFRGRRWMWVDPMKDMAAAVVAVDHGWKTNTQVAGDLGQDFDDNVDEIGRETNKTKGTSLDKTQTGNPAARAVKMVQAVAETEKEHENEIKAVEAG